VAVAEVERRLDGQSPEHFASPVAVDMCTDIVHTSFCTISLVSLGGDELCAVWGVGKKLTSLSELDRRCLWKARSKVVL
jgi:hypothetical protein